MDIIKGIFLIIIGYCIKWLENYIRNRNPLSIKIDQNFAYEGHGGIRGVLSFIGFRMKIDFRNNTKNETNVMISDISFYPQEEIELFDFEYENGVYPEIKSSPITDFPINPGSKLVYFKFKIKGNNKFDIDDFEKYNNISMIFKIEYGESPGFKKRTQRIIIENFFNNLVETIKSKNIF